MKYQLTQGAREAINYIAAAWKACNLEQQLTITVRRDGDKFSPGFTFGATGEFKSPPLAIWWELSKFQLVDIRRGSDLWEILLLQELLNAAENDFEVSEYFLTLNAVGTIIQGNLSIESGGILQSAASNTGDIQQSVEDIADILVRTLGDKFLQTQTELKSAIDRLRVAEDSDKQSKLGKVISELGRSLEHGANTAAVVGALTAIAPVIQKLLAG